MIAMSLGPFSRQQADHPAPRTDGLPKTRPRSQQQVLATGPSQPRGPWQRPAFQAQDSWSAWGHGVRACVRACVCVCVCVCAGSGGGWEDMCDPSCTCETPSVQACAGSTPHRARPEGPLHAHLGRRAAPAAAQRPQGPSRRQPLAPVASSLISSNAACSSSLK